MTRWEYKVVPASDASTLSAGLNELGAEGWEVIEVLALPRDTSLDQFRPTVEQGGSPYPPSPHSPHVLLKRPQQTD